MKRSWLYTMQTLRLLILRIVRLEVHVAFNCNTVHFVTSPTRISVTIANTILFECIDTL